MKGESYGTKPEYYIVESLRLLPEIFQRSPEAKRIAETQTTKGPMSLPGCRHSRSAFYKYRDSIAPFQNLMARRIITFR